MFLSELRTDTLGWKSAAPHAPSSEITAVITEAFPR